jgi:L-ascorbate metabolism protein UlaG (beta-lactamase superfamily)
VQLTKLGHACVRLSHGGTTVVIDPGTFSGPGGILDGAHAVLVTHQHFDHFDVDRLFAAARAEPELEIWTNPAVAALLRDLEGRVHPVAHGDRFSVGDLDIHVYGEKHAPTHLEPILNVGFLVAGEAFHPGDALTVPEEQVPTLLIPTNAPWLKSIEVVEYAAQIAPQRAYSVHDGLLNDIGLSIVDNILSTARGSQDRDYRRIPVGDSVELG